MNAAVIYRQTATSLTLLDTYFVFIMFKCIFFQRLTDLNCRQDTLPLGFFHCRALKLLILCFLLAEIMKIFPEKDVWIAADVAPKPTDKPMRENILVIL